MTVPAAGALRRRLTLEAPVRGADDGGAAATTWSALADVWAAVTPKSGREIVDADGQVARVTHQVAIRWRSDVKAAMRFRDGASLYVVHATFDGDPHRRHLVCLVEELAP